jgi:hypothetical protein
MLSLAGQRCKFGYAVPLRVRAMPKKRVKEKRDLPGSSTGAAKAELTAATASMAPLRRVGLCMLMVGWLNALLSRKLSVGSWITEIGWCCLESEGRPCQRGWRK